MAEIYTGYNLVSSAVNLYNQVEHCSEARKAQLLEKLSTKNESLKDLSQFVSLLTQKQTSGKADFNSDPVAIELIDRIRESFSTHEGISILPPHTYSWQGEEIERTLDALKQHVTILSQDINMVNMDMQNEYQTMMSVIESIKKMIEESSQLNQSIHRRTG
ncbi:MAG: hypothetical protein EBZ47_06335 [Chlamydiae bacterium]|nr:hypothetical protein [Chlamydiota bacterium]